MAVICFNDVESNVFFYDVLTNEDHIDVAKRLGRANLEQEPEPNVTAAVHG